MFQELSSMQKLTHPNVVPYYGLSMEHHPSLTTVRVFEEFVYATNFSHFLTENLPVELAALRHYVSSILEALAFMHQVPINFNKDSSIRCCEIFLITFLRLSQTQIIRLLSQMTVAVKYIKSLKHH